MKINGSALKIAVDSKGPWVVNGSGKIYQRVNGLWMQKKGCAKDIGAGANN